MAKKKILRQYYNQITMDELVTMATSCRGYDISGKFIITGNNHNRVTVVLSLYDEFRGQNTTHGSVTISGHADDAIKTALSEKAQFINGLNIVRVGDIYTPVFCCRSRYEFRVFVIDEYPTDMMWGRFPHINLADNREVNEEIKKLRKELAEYRKAATEAAEDFQSIIRKVFNTEDTDTEDDNDFDVNADE